MTCMYLRTHSLTHCMGVTRVQSPIFPLFTEFVCCAAETDTDISVVTAALTMYVCEIG